MFCISCGVEFPDGANFCLKCGKPQHPASDAPTPTPMQGRWEYSEFSEPIPGKLRCPEDHDQAMDQIDIVVKFLLGRLAPFGWEPMEPVEASRLLSASRIFTETIDGFFSEREYYSKVRINFRRWVTDDQAKKDAEVEAKTGKLAKTSFDVIFVACGPNKINAIKAVRDVTTLGLKESLYLVEHPGAVIRHAVSRAEAESIRDRMLRSGATIEVR